MLMMLLVKVILIPLEPLKIQRIQPASQGMTRVTRILKSKMPGDLCWRFCQKYCGIILQPSAVDINPFVSRTRTCFW